MVFSVYDDIVMIVDGAHATHIGGKMEDDSSTSDDPLAKEGITEISNDKIAIRGNIESRTKANIRDTDSTLRVIGAQAFGCMTTLLT